VSERDINPHAETIEYTGDPETWSRIIGAAEDILRVSGSTRDNGIVDAEWGSDFMGKQFALIRQLIGQRQYYWLRFYEQFADTDNTCESMISFEVSPTHVTGIFGDIVNVYATYPDANARIERADIDLMSYVITHPFVDENRVE
jgi:hypothetical protein